jgi:hypothetical protein
MHVQKNIFIKLLYARVYARTQVHAHDAYLQPTAKTNCPHYIHQSIDRLYICFPDKAHMLHSLTIQITAQYQW